MVSAVAADPHASPPHDDCTYGRVVGALQTLAERADAGDLAGWVGCFADDGRLEVRSDGQVVLGARGARELAVAAGKLLSTNGVRRHLTGVVAVSYGADAVTCSSYYLALDVFEAAPVVRAFGTYRDTMVPAADGHGWLVAERTVDVAAFRAGQIPILDQGPTR